MNVFEIDEIPKLDNEIFKKIFEHKNIKIKKIISNTIKTPKTFYQKEDEFVLLLKGCAKLEINGKVIKLRAGEYIFIPSNTKHTLLKTKKTAIWLAIYMK